MQARILGHGVASRHFEFQQLLTLALPTHVNIQQVGVGGVHRTMELDAASERFALHTLQRIIMIGRRQMQSASTVLAPAAPPPPHGGIYGEIEDMGHLG